MCPATCKFYLDDVCPRNLGLFPTLTDYANTVVSLYDEIETLKQQIGDDQ